MGIQHLNHNNMRFLIVAALCSIASAAPEGRRLRPEEHWMPAQGRDLSKYKPRAAMVDANGDDLMEKINRVAAELRLPSTPGPGRWLSSSTTPGSAAAPSSPRTTS